MSANPVMKPTSPTILLLASGAMELTWRLAWAGFLMMSVAQRVFPLPAAIGAFSLAAAFTAAARGRGWRWITIIGLHSVGCLLATLYMSYAFTYRAYPLWSLTWLNALFNPPNHSLEGLISLFIVFWALLFWVSGIQFARRSTAYRVVCGRFDAGIGMFCGLLLFKLALEHNDLQIRDPLTGWLILPFLLCGLIAIGSARNRDHPSKTYRTGYRIIGVVLSFTTLIFASSVGLLLLLWPYFTLTAEKGYDLLQQGLHPFIPVLAAILRFLFMPRRGSVSSPPMPAGNGEIATAPGETSWWMTLLEKILSWGFGGLLALLFVGMLGLGVWRLIQWLWTKTPGAERKPHQSGSLLVWLRKLLIALRLWWEWIVRRIHASNTAAQCYRMLDDWGRHSGLPRRRTETPREYGARLIGHFPAIQEEIILIVTLFQQEVYGERALNPQQVTLASQAVRQLRRPIYWPSRLRTWFRKETDASCENRLTESG